MKLYHGTFEHSYKNIVKDKALKPQFNNMETDIIDEALNSYTEEYNLREGAIFLFDDIKYANCYDEIWETSVDKLDKNLLYVADFRTSTDIYDYIMHGKDAKDTLRSCRSYTDNFMSYKEYLLNKDKIQIPEFLYFGEIPLNDMKLETLDDVIQRLL